MDDELGEAGTAPDVLTQVRRTVCPPLDRLATPIGGYAQCVMDADEYVGAIEREVDSFAAELRSMGFRREPVSALKRHEDGRLSAGSWVRRSGLLADGQLHVTIFRGSRRTVDVFAHWEYSWITHPIKHYRATGWDTEQGVRMMRALLEGRGITTGVG